MTHAEMHKTHRVSWLRAAVLGANDGIVSTASLVIGIAAASTTQAAIILAGLAGLVAGAMSMAAGEYVSVSSQADTERADLDLERRSLALDQASETRELARIYPDLPREAVAERLGHPELGAVVAQDPTVWSKRSTRSMLPSRCSRTSYCTTRRSPPPEPVRMLMLS